MTRFSLSSFLCLLLGISHFANAVTIYTTFTTDENGRIVKPTPTNTDTAVGPAYTGYSAYNLTTLQAPALPNPLPNLNIDVRVYAGGMNGLSVKQRGSLMGFSIELSVANQFLGRNSSRLNVPFLNYLGALKQRMGQGMVIRVGGNSQEHTSLYPTPFANYEIINKTNDTSPNNPTGTPAVDIDIDLLYAMQNISTLLETQWYLGLPFSYPVNATGIWAMTEIFEEVLGNNLIALQLGNEPDLYGQGYRGRPFDYWIPQYLDDYNEVLPGIGNNSAISRKDIILSPSICCNIPGNWSLDNLLATNFLQNYNEYLAQIAVQFYPNNNCAGDNPPQAQDVFAGYLSHEGVVNNVQKYINASAVVQAGNKPLVMFETNTASCAGFPGLSDSFGAALWAIDWTMQLGYINFTTVLFHFGGQDASYNAFTPPPSSYGTDYQWSTGALFYSFLMIAEAMGSSNVSQIVDLQMNNNNPYTPGYAIYENGQPARVLVINYMNDPSGASAYNAYVHIGGVNGLPETTPSSATVRFLSAPSVSEKFNISWAGQTYPGQFRSDGILQGNVATTTIQCPGTTGCQITVPAPGAALVFLNTNADSESYNSQLTATFPTTYYGKNAGPTEKQAVLQTSNGRGGAAMKGVPLGSTSHGNNVSSATMVTVGMGSTLIALLLGAAMVSRMLASVASAGSR